MGELQDCTRLITFQYSILKLWNNLPGCPKVICLYKQSGFTDIITCIHKYCSPIDVECYQLQDYSQNIMCPETIALPMVFNLLLWIY